MNKIISYLPKRLDKKRVADWRIDETQDCFRKVIVRETV